MLTPEDHDALANQIVGCGGIDMKELIERARNHQPHDKCCGVVYELADLVEDMQAVVDAGHQLYLKCHNMQQVRPKWANDSVCETMQVMGKALAKLEALT